MLVFNSTLVSPRDLRKSENGVLLRKYALYLTGLICDSGYHFDFSNPIRVDRLSQNDANLDIPTLPRPVTCTYKLI